MAVSRGVAPSQRAVSYLHTFLCQMNAFCNADDISWGTKNLDTKRTDHETAKMASKALAYQAGVGGCERPDA